MLKWKHCYRCSHCETRGEDGGGGGGGVGKTQEVGIDRRRQTRAKRSDMMDPITSRGRVGGGEGAGNSHLVQLSVPSTQQS